MTDLLSRISKAMQESPAWPAVFDAGTAQELARVAVEAMREPTDAMISAGVEARNKPGSGASVSITYRAMIDAALSQ